MQELFPRLRPFLRLCSKSVLLLAVWAVAADFALAKRFSVNAPQSWVRPLEYTAPGSPAKTGSGSSSSFLLDDHQTRVNGRSVDRYAHHVLRVDNTAGLDDLSQLRFEFEPSYQQLTIHFVRIRRGAEVTDALRPSEVKIIQQEEGLNQQLYNGTLAALIFLEDVRVGDIIDYSYSVNGENPVLNGLFADTFHLADEQPIEHLSHRLLWPSARQLSIKPTNTDIAPRIQQVGTETEYVWDRHNLSAIDVEDGTPGWFHAYPTVSLSEFHSWSDVTQWALPLYRDASLGAATAKVKEWEKRFPSLEERTTAALRFVQDEIRYLGIELGRYSHQPTAPAKVFSRRFGDCKDKSLLLVGLLKALGVDAAPALVDSSGGRWLDNGQPSPFAFDHVIVQAKIGDRTYWFDPTISYQRGGLDKYYDPTYERALVLRDGTAGLETIPLPTADSGSVFIHERYDGPPEPASVTLVVRTTYKRSEADDMRHSLSQTSLAELSKQLSELLRFLQPGYQSSWLTRSGRRRDEQHDCRN